MLFKKSVLLTDSFEKYKRIRNILENNGIKTKLKIHDNSAVWLGRGTTRGINFKINNHKNLMYELLVNNKNAEQAEYLIRSNYY